MKNFVQIITALATSFICSVAAAPGIEFRTVDLFIDSHDQPLAAYQLDWSIATQNATIVGIEGGEHPAFRNPPYYDPKAIQHERVIVAAFTVDSSTTLPKGRTRVATIHLQTTAGAACEYKFQKFEAADPDGRRISIEASSQERKAP
jgi:hypothetical protein